MKDVRSRFNRDYRLQNIGSRLQQNLTKAVLSGAKVIEEVLMDGLADAAAYKLEYDKLREYVFAGNRDQLWNVIPGSIYTPQELQAFAERLQRNLNSRDRWIRYLSERTLAALIRGPATRGTAPLGIDTANTQTFRIRPVTFGKLYKAHRQGTRTQTQRGRVRQKSARAASSRCGTFASIVADLLRMQGTAPMTDWEYMRVGAQQLFGRTQA